MSSAEHIFDAAILAPIDGELPKLIYRAQGIIARDEDAAKVKAIQPQEIADAQRQPERVPSERQAEQRPQETAETKVESKAPEPAQVAEPGTAKVQAIDRKSGDLVELDVKADKVKESLREERKVESWLKRLKDCLAGK